MQHYSCHKRIHDFDCVHVQMRQIMISVVLSTDMFQHFSLLAVWNAKVEAQPDVWAWRDRMLLLVMTMHLADIVNPARPVNIAVKWGTLIVEECMQQVRIITRTRLYAMALLRASCFVELSATQHRHASVSPSHKRQPCMHMPGGKAIK